MFIGPLRLCVAYFSLTLNTDSFYERNTWGLDSKKTQDFIQSGDFYLWVESDEVNNKVKNTLHPQHLPEKPCFEFLKNVTLSAPINARQGVLLSLLFPTFEEGKPLPSPELQRVEPNETVTLQNW